MPDIYSFQDLARDFNTQGIDVYDVFGGTNHFNDWCEAKGFGETDPQGYARGSSASWYSEYISCPDGAGKRPPPANLRHWMFDNLDMAHGWSKDNVGMKFIDVIITQEIIDRTSWVSAIMSVMLATSGGELKLRLYL